MLDSLPVAAQSSVPISTAVEEIPSGFVLQGYFRRGQLAIELGISTRTLDRLIAKGDGPPRVKIGRTVLYRLTSIHEWLQEREKPTASVHRLHAAPRKSRFAR